MLGPIIASAAIGAASLSTPTDLRPIFDRPSEFIENTVHDSRIVASVERTEDGLVYTQAPRRTEREIAQGKTTEAIHVEVDGNVFVIDPYVPITHRPTEADVRYVFGQRGLTDDLGRSTNRARFPVRYRAVETLFRKLEVARHRWLRSTGNHMAGRVWKGSPSSDEETTNSSGMPRPSGVIELPADFPRTRALESVDAGGLPTRISLPPTIPQRIADSLQSRVETTRVVSSDETTGDEG